MSSEEKERDAEAEVAVLRMQLLAARRERDFFKERFESLQREEREKRERGESAEGYSKKREREEQSGERQSGESSQQREESKQKHKQKRDGRERAELPAKKREEVAEVAPPRKKTTKRFKMCEEMDDASDDELEIIPDTPEQIKALIGQYVSATFHGYGTFYGVVSSYSPPYYRVCYEDGDTEEMSSAEVLSRRVSSPDSIIPEIKENIRQSVENFENKNSESDDSAGSDEEEDVIDEISPGDINQVWSVFSQAVQNKDVAVIAKSFYTLEHKAILDMLRTEEETMNLKSGKKSHIMLKTCLDGEQILARWQSEDAIATGTMIDIYSSKWKVWYRAKVMSAPEDVNVKLHFMNWKNSHDETLSQEEWKAALIAPAYCMLTSDKYNNRYLGKKVKKEKKPHSTSKNNNPKRFKSKPKAHPIQSMKNVSAARIMQPIRRHSTSH